jgi:hypothetical protein
VSAAPGPVINGLSEIIYETCQAVAREQYFPTRDADAMDDFIKQGRDKIITLRQLRTMFEDTMTGVLL